MNEHFHFNFIEFCIFNQPINFLEMKYFWHLLFLTFSIFCQNSFSIEIFDEKSPLGKAGQNCVPLRMAGSESFVCVCNSTFCDWPADDGQMEGGKAIVYISDANEMRLHRKEIQMGGEFGDEFGHQKPLPSVNIRVDPSKEFQTLLGFGGSFTDAAGFNMNSVSRKTRLRILRAYFDRRIGIRYTVGRVPLASCDFSTRVYSYCDTDGDFELKTFALAREDLEMKIPIIRIANLLSGKRLRLVATPWSAPAWMKTTGKMKGGGKLKGPFNGKYYRTYANYFRRFFEEYARIGRIQFWGMTMQNEPQYGADLDYHFQTLWFSPQMQREFANELLAPILKQSNASSNILILGHDDDRNLTFDASKIIYEGNGNSSSSIAGLAFHWYDHDSQFDHSILSRIHSLFPNKFLLGTEACTGWIGPPSELGPALGNWTRAEMYANDIVRNLRNWAVGWTDWNLCLDLGGGPNWVNNFVDSPIIVNSAKDEFYKQPMFYAMAHFSRFISPGSIRIHSEFAKNSSIPVEFVAFKNPINGQRILVVISSCRMPVKINVEENGTTIKFTIPPKAFATIIWPQGK